MTLSTFLIMGQYVHLPWRVQCVGIIFLVLFSAGGYEIEALVPMNELFDVRISCIEHSCHNWDFGGFLSFDIQ